MPASSCEGPSLSPGIGGGFSGGTDAAAGRVFCRPVPAKAPHCPPALEAVSPAGRMLRRAAFFAGQFLRRPLTVPRHWGRFLPQLRECHGSKGWPGQRTGPHTSSIVTAVEKKPLLLFNKCGDDSPHRPQNGLAVDFIAGTGGLTRQRLRRCLKIGICRFSTVLTISAEHPVGPGPLTRPFPRQSPSPAWHSRYKTRERTPPACR